MTKNKEATGGNDAETLEPATDESQATAYSHGSPPTHLSRVFPCPLMVDYFVVPWPIHQSLLIGREPRFDGRLVLSDQMVSREHARLTSTAGRTLLEDLGSRNGTYLNGVRVAKGTVRCNDVIRVGGTLFVATTQSPESRPDLTDMGLVVESMAMATLVHELGRQAHTCQTIILVGEPGTGKASLAPTLHLLGSFVGHLAVVDCARWRSDGGEEPFQRFAIRRVQEALRGSAGSLPRITVILQDIHHIVAADTEEAVAALEPHNLIGEFKTALGPGVRLVYTLDLSEEVTEEFFRLVVPSGADDVLNVPALRERKEDVVAIVWQHLCNEGADPRVRLTADVVEYILCQSWPDNVEELVQVLSICLSRQKREHQFQLSLLQELLEPRPGESTAGETVTLKKSPSLLELRLALAAAQGNVLEACRRQAWHPRQVYRWAEKYGIKLGGKGRHRTR
jgi:hypothetical protein